MIVVLAVYAAAVFSFVSRNLSQSLDQQLRRDFQWAAATVDETREGVFTWAEPEDIAAEEDLPWVQVWSQDGQLLFRNSEAERRPIPETRDLALREGTSPTHRPSSRRPVLPRVSSRAAAASARSRW